MFGRNSHSSLSLQANSNSSNESFKLVEKIQPKKTRTKYTKDQVSYSLNSNQVFFINLG